jgi:putative acetyltransferase
MRTSLQHLRQGVAATLLTHLLAEAKNRGYKKVSLETGTAEAFVPAQKLNQRFGFVECQPFADYQHDPYSVFMTNSI